VNDLFAGALFPGLLLVGLYIVYQIIFSALRPKEAPAVPREELVGVSTWEFVKHLTGALFAPIILIVAVLGSILGGLASPTEAAGVGAVGAIMLAGYRTDPARGKLIMAGAASMGGLLLLTALFDLRMQRVFIPTGEKAAILLAILFSLVLAAGLFLAVKRVYAKRTEGGERVLTSVMQSTTIISSMVFIILVGAAMFSLVFRGFGGDLWIEEFLHALPGGVFTAMLLVMAVMFVMGFFLDFLEIIFIVVPIVSPILLQMEMGNGELMSPVWLGVMMAINLQTSFLTPPFGFALFYLRGVAPEAVRTTDIYRGIVPFVLIQIFGLGLIALLPEVATWLPVALYGR
jgi:TRAP-type mannitol/chloroaromatic compound transport system permease large subunit